MSPYGVTDTVATPSALGIEKPVGWIKEMVVDPVCRKATVKMAPKSPGWMVMVGGTDPTDVLLLWTVTARGRPPARACTTFGKLVSSSVTGNTLNAALPEERLRDTDGGYRTIADGSISTLPVAG